MKSGFRAGLVSSVGASFSVVANISVSLAGDDKRLRHLADEASYRSLGVCGVPVFSIIFGLKAARSVA